MPCIVSVASLMLFESTSCSERTVTFDVRSPAASRSAARATPPMYSSISRKAPASVPISSWLVMSMCCSRRPRAISVAAVDSVCMAPIMLRSVPTASRPRASSDTTSTTVVTQLAVSCSVRACAKAAVIAASFVVVCSCSCFDSVACVAFTPSMPPVRSSFAPVIRPTLARRAAAAYVVKLALIVRMAVGSTLGFVASVSVNARKVALMLSAATTTPVSRAPTASRSMRWCTSSVDWSRRLASSAGDACRSIRSSCVCELRPRTTVVPRVTRKPSAATTGRARILARSDRVRNMGELLGTTREGAARAALPGTPSLTGIGYSPTALKQSAETVTPPAQLSFPLRIRDQQSTGRP